MINKKLFWSSIRKRPWFLGFSLVFITAAIAVALIYPKGQDVVWISGIRNPALNHSFQFITKMGEEWIFIIMIIMQVLYISYRQAISFSLSALMSLIVAFFTKAIFQMPRPLVYFRDLNRIDEIGTIPGYEFYSSFTSFPSGHTMAAFSFFILVALFNKQIFFQVLAFILAASVGISRIYLGQHFSGDVAVGALLGIIISLSIYYFTHWKLSDFKMLDRSLIDLKALKN